MSLTAHFAVHRPEHTTRIDLEAASGEVVGLIGPNGAGKSTALRSLAGLIRPSEGEITLSGRVVESADVHVPAHERAVGFVFQDHLLFPHLSALDNVAFGPRAAGRSRREAQAYAQDWLERLGVADLARRRPAQLSGGQAQRVAIARALATDPQLLLLDEPTAALDAAGAMALRTQLRTHLDAFEGVAVIVTHVALDAMVMTDRLVVIDNGLIVQQGSPADVAAHPRTQHVAALVGLNLTKGVAVDGTVSLESGGVITSAERVQGAAFAAFSPGAVSLYATPPAGSPRNVWEGRVTSLAPHGDAVRVQVDVPWPLLADITPAALAGMGLQDGSRVWASVKATEVTVYPA